MCGIAGIYHYNREDQISKQLLTAMRETMTHRGPDGGDNWISEDGKVGLAHRRLSIIDLSTSAAQPMGNETKKIWITFNGEVYNHAKLRQELIHAGHQFQTNHSDTEVLIHGYEQWGLDELLRRIEGDFAFVIWDSQAERLILVRDRIGVKPLYFSIKNGRILFGSEIKAILADSTIERDIEPVAMEHYLSFLTTPAPFTMFKDIYKLPAGFCMQISKGDIKSWRYWDMFPERAVGKTELTKLKGDDSEEFYINGIKQILRESVKKRMMSDVPVGVFLSGGVDSSTNVALMSQFTNIPLETFTVGFKDFQHLNELDEARLISKIFKTNHHEILIDESDMRGYLDEMIHHQDEPIADWVCIPLHFISKLAKESGITVVQVGEGSDEQFAGYSGYLSYLKLHKKYWTPFQKFMPEILQKLLARIAVKLASIFPRYEIYADIVYRAAYKRELFWGGAIAYWNITKNKLLDSKRTTTQNIPQELIECGLFDEGDFTKDSFNIIKKIVKNYDENSLSKEILARMTYIEFKLRLPELLLMRVDKITMASSLEARVPFLDHKLVEWVAKIPMSSKLRNFEPKYLLKKAVEGLIPNEIIYRKKMGFGAPMSQWLRGDFGVQVRSEIFSSKILERKIFNLEFIDGLFNEHFSGRRDNGLHIWVLYNLSRWYDYWIVEKSKA
jgi:asparagine synthase (glutamine-hydrolysing)